MRLCRWLVLKRVAAVEVDCRCQIQSRGRLHGASVNACARARRDAVNVFVGAFSSSSPSSLFINEIDQDK